MGVSAILPIHNEATVLGRVLDCIGGQTQKPDQLVIVLDACTDGSELIARGYPASLVVVDVRNTAAAVLAGVREASHEIMVLFDGNTLVPPDYLARLTQVHEETHADLVEWHGGMMLLPRATLQRFGTPSMMHLWTLEYFLRIKSGGGRVVHLDGLHRRLKRSPLKRNVRYGLDYADLSERYHLAPFFRVGTKSGWIPDTFAIGGSVVGHLRAGRLRRSLMDLVHRSTAANPFS